MSGEEAAVENIDTNAEVVENTEITEVAETSEVNSSEVTLSTVHEMSDDELDVFLATEIPTGSDLEASSSEQPPSEASEQAEPVGEAEAQEAESAEDGEESEPVDYEQFYDELFGTPFKASGREIQIENVDEAKRLIQQGFDYSKKMNEFAPFKKAMNLLKKRDALDPEKLDFLLDVAEGKPEAVSKLLKDQQLDPLDIDVDAGDNYVSEYEDTESSNEVLNILDNVSDSARQTTLSLLTASENSWDEQSKQAIIANAPQAIPVLTRQMESGQFDTIMSEVTKKRALGELTNISDLDAYNMVGAELSKQGRLGVPNTPNDSTTQTRPKQKVDVQTKRKKAAGAPRKAASNVPPAQSFNPATATEAELEKFIQSHLRNSG